MKLKELFHLGGGAPDEEPHEAANGGRLSDSVLPEHQRDRLEKDMMVLDEDYLLREKRVQKEAEKTVQEAAETSLKKLHLIQRGRCPVCGAHLNQHLFATVCETCNFNSYEVPRRGPVRVHLAAGGDPVTGELCYALKNGDVLVIKEDVVVAKIPSVAVSWIEYVWTESEIDHRYTQLTSQFKLICGWCGEAADPEKDGFHLAQVAFGSNQERYVFCCDDCYEAFRKMYPARVHRNCYEINCAECNLCVKRYDDENDGIHLLAKDFLRMKQSGQKGG